MTDRYLVHIGDHALLRISGSESRSFLQGLISNDINRLEPSHPVYAALLTPQGKFLHDFMLFDDGNGDILMDVAQDWLEALQRRLMLYRLRAKVEIGVDEQGVVLASFGGVPSHSPEGFTSFVDPRHKELGYRLIGERHFMPETLDDPALYDLHRLKLGIPDGRLDLVQERSTLAEAGFEELDGVSFDKGCYVGQELTARMKHRGLVKRKLLPVLIEGHAPEPGTVLELDGREALEMRSSRGGYGMALVRLDRLDDISAHGGIAFGDGMLRLSSLIGTGTA